MEAHTQRLAVNRHIGATARSVCDGGFDLGFGLFTSTGSKSTHATRRASLICLTHRIGFHPPHDLHEQPGRRFQVLALLPVSQVLIPAITFANDPGFAGNDRPARATAAVAK